MKAATTKTATVKPASKESPFFNKNRGEDFFHGNKAENSFFGSRSAKGVQTKLTVGKPNDPYEREADAMADRVVQRFSESSPVIQKKETAGKNNGSFIQAKCSKCEQEEKLQKKQKNELLINKVLRKPIKGNNDEKNHQYKALFTPNDLSKYNISSHSNKIHTKCAHCEQEETVQKKQNALQDKVYRKSIFESNDEKQLQRKSLINTNGPVRENHDHGSIQRRCKNCEQEEKLQKKENPDKTAGKILLKPDTEQVRNSIPVKVQAAKNISIIPPAPGNPIQQKCSSCENEEKVQAKDEEDDNVSKPRIHKKPVFESENNQDETIQRKCRECEEGSEVLLKREGIIQRDFSEEGFAGGGSRDAIIAAAKGELGKVRARENDGTGKRVGSERLLEYFHLAAPGVWDDSIIETHGAAMPSWCGIFSVWAHKKAGRDIGNWQMGKGVSAFGTLTTTDSPQPGDIGYIDKPYQHHCIVHRIDGDTIHTIDGNSGLQSEVVENSRPRSKFSGFFTAFGGGTETIVQSKEENNNGHVQLKSEEHAASASIEQQLNNSKGKGQSLPEAARSGMEHGFSADFSNVRIHTDSNAVQMSKDLHAHAFTHGSDIYFNNGKFDTGSSSGQRLLAHELTHVVQQGSAPAGIVNRSSVSDESPASENGEAADMTPSEIEQSVRKDMQNDDYGGTSDLESEDVQEEGGASPAPSPGVEEDSETSEPEEAQEQEEQEDPGPADENESESVPDGTPAEGGGGSECPNIIPEFPEAPAGPIPEEEDESIYRDLFEIVATSSITGPHMFLLRVAGTSAYRIWRSLPVSFRIRIINFVLDRAITGAYMGSILGRYSDMGGGLLSAAMLGFFKRIRIMPDIQKLRMFEKFARLILRGDVRYMLGVMKGILMGFFIDGLLGIVQLVIDIICIVPKILNFLKTVQNFLSQLPYEVMLIKNSIEEMMASAGEVLNNAMSEIMDMIRNPHRISAILDKIYAAGVQAAEKAGKAMADGMIRYAALPLSALGEVVGRIAGQIIFEAVLAYFTVGGGTAITASKLALRAISKSMAILGRQIFRILRLLGRVLKTIKKIINSIIKFLTPLLQRVARLARRVIDRLAKLFKTFGRHCHPGSIKCNLPKPKCKGRYVSRLGGFLPHDRYVRRVTGTTRDYRLTGTVFGVPVPCNYDARKMPRRLIEGKTGYRYMPFIQRSNPALFRAIMFRFNEQRWRCMAIAARCGYSYTWYMQQGPVAAFLNSRWHGAPPVLHVP